MKNDLLLQINKEYNVPNFHGDYKLDTLKYLSEMESLPDLIKNDYTVQYESALYKLEICDVRNFGEYLYNHFNGDDDIILCEVVDECRWKNVTMQARKIQTPYYERMKNYLNSIGKICKVSSEQIVLDIIIDDHSTLKTILNKPKTENKYIMNHSLSSLFLINNRDYAINDAFVSPYNGIPSISVLEILNKFL